LVAADGTLNWFCVPDFDGPPILGALLDSERGGYCRLGPKVPAYGQQRYQPGTATVLTTWSEGGGKTVLDLADVMAHPGREREANAHGERIIIRRLRAATAAAVTFELFPRRNFEDLPGEPCAAEGGAAFNFDDGTLRLWTSLPVRLEKEGVSAAWELSANEECWVVLGWNSPLTAWSAQQAARVFADAEQYWRGWSAELTIPHAGTREDALRRSAITVQLLSHAERDSAVAALTTSLPERVGGDRNYDYRFAWVRDASLSLSLLARMGKVEEVERYLHWLSSLPPAAHAPLQVCYRLDGTPHLEQEDVPGVCGYEQSRPVRRGNRAAKQMQLGSLGFFADCARIFVDHGGKWQEEFWRLLKRAADFTCRSWREKDSGVWELPEEAHYVASRVMSWVVLERAVYIAGKTGHGTETDHWRETAAQIHAEVMEQGWSEEKQAFRQRYGSDALDAAALLIPLMGFLPVDDPRVTATLAAIERELVIDGLVHRFNPVAMPSGGHIPIGRFEGAFLPCVFWYAHTLAQAGRCDEAEAVLRQCEAISGETGLFAEEADAKHGTFLGNTPLLFSHVEYARAVMQLNESRHQQQSAI
jgi:GH15 family glucan-1,4-alpha-glucosidase